MGLGRARGKRAMAGAVLGAGIVVAVVAACSGKKNNELVLALQTDLSLPKDVDLIRIEVVQGGSTLFKQEYPVGPGGAKIPATLGVLDNPDNPGQPVTIRVIARQNGTLRILRQSRTSIPGGRTATLRMPLHWLCWNHDGDPADGGDPQPSCPDGQSCINGSCADENVDPAKLADFNPADIFGGGTGGGDGNCLDTVNCFSQGKMVTVQEGDCSLDNPGTGGAGINVAMVRRLGVPGICGSSACYVPIDSDPDLGWSVSPTTGRIALPPAVCERMKLPASDKLSIVGVAVTTACSTKTAQYPACGPWSSVNPEAGTFNAAAPAGFDGGGGTGTLPDGGTCDPNVQWPKMLAAPIVPPNLIAGLDLTANGTKTSITIDDAMHTNCASGPATPVDPGYSAIAWGSQGDVFVEYNPTTRFPYLIAVQKGYAGRVSFDAPSAEAGTHHFDIGVGAFLEDSVATTIDWQNAQGLVRALYAGYMASFYKSVTPDPDCIASGDCYVQPSQNNSSALAIAVHQTFPLYVVFPTGGSVPTELYTYWAAGKIAGATDGGVGEGGAKCGPLNCTGCCDAKTGSCLSGVSNAACGINGSICNVCSGGDGGTSCTNGICQ